MSSSQKMLHAFKIATPETLKQGTASLKFERMINTAEKKIMEMLQQKTKLQSTESLANSLAWRLLHQPGSILSKAEIARIYTGSGCEEQQGKED